MSEFYIDPEGLQPDSDPENLPARYDFDLTVTPGNGADDETRPDDAVAPIIADETRAPAYPNADERFPKEIDAEIARFTRAQLAEITDPERLGDSGAAPMLPISPLIEFLGEVKRQGHMSDDEVLDVLSGGIPEERARLERKFSTGGGLDAYLGIGGAATGNDVEYDAGGGGGPTEPPRAELVRSGWPDDEEPEAASDDSAADDRFPPPPEMLGPGETRRVVVKKGNTTVIIDATGGSEAAPFYKNVTGSLRISRNPDGITHIEDNREPKPPEWPEAD